MRTRIIAAAAAATAAAVLLTGCSGGSAHHTADTKAADNQFLTAAPDFLVDNLDHGTLIKFAHQMCDAFDTPSTRWIDLINVAINVAHFTAYEAGGIVASAVLTYCPEYADKLPDPRR
jgi:PBP1b-binding outer membrane lipoprotein LpoB